jgi:hypothetical protein
VKPEEAMSDKPKEGGKIVRHPDVKAMGVIAESMDAITDEADKAAVVVWFNRKYNPETRPGGVANEGDKRSDAQ